MSHTQATTPTASTLERWPLDRLIRNPNNSRLHSDAQIQLIGVSINRFGFNNPILANADGNVIAGHGRLEAAARMGLAEVPVVVLDHLSDEEQRAYLIADNRLGDLAGWDEQLLCEELLALQDLGIAHDLLGYNDADLAKLVDEFTPGEDLAALESEDPAGKLDRAEELLEKWQVANGMLWKVGEHRLLCGDARDASAVERLLDGTRADLVFTDPPYGVDYVGKTRDALTIENDSHADLRPLLSAALANAFDVSRPGAIWYVMAPPGPQFLDFAQVLTDLGVWRQTLAWVKNSFVLGHSDFHYRHEAVLYGWRPGAAHRPPQERTHDSIWEFDRPNRSEHHPTTKPIELIGQAIMISSPPSAIVLDPFAGSGSTMVAAEGTGRSCCAMELEPKYCAVVLERMESMGVHPKLIGS